ncbi:MAG: hypothetical protein OXU71_01455 [Gammaproteobacteria bacterium]|nr:hypothetical protein [Gammaproteobacteria bacterium]
MVVSVGVKGLGVGVDVDSEWQARVVGAVIVTVDWLTPVSPG